MTPGQSGVNPDYQIKTSGLTPDDYETFKLGVTPTQSDTHESEIYLLCKGINALKE